MPYYLFRGRYTTDSIKNLVKRPQDRETEVRPLIEAAGGKLHHLFFAFGDEDVIALIEAPDDKAMGACAFVVGASGTMASGATTKLMTSKEAMESMKTAAKTQAAYRPVMA